MVLSGAALFLEVAPQLTPPHAQQALECVLPGTHLRVGTVAGHVGDDVAFDLLKYSRRLFAGDGAWLRLFFYTYSIIHKTQKFSVGCICVLQNYACVALVVRIFFTKRC